MRSTLYIFLLTKMKETALSQALMMSMPKVFEARVKQELLSASSRVLIAAYMFCVKNDVKEASLKCVIELVLLRMQEVENSYLQLLRAAILKTKSRLPEFQDLQTQFQDLLARRIFGMSLRE